MAKLQEFDPSKIKWKSRYAFQAYGVGIVVKADNSSIISEFKNNLPNILPTGWVTIKSKDANHQFYITAKEKRRKIHYTAYKGKELVSGPNPDIKILLDMMESHVRITIAEFAVEHVFIHAGVVARNGKAIMIPGRSYSGKTTLTAELSKRGFDYYSDEYAVIDKEGLVHPFTKTLSMRGIIDDWSQVEIPVEEIGGRKGDKALPIGLILVTKYKKGAKFIPKELSSGKGIIESLDNSVSIRQNPQLVLSVLTKVGNQAKIIQTNRTDAEKFVDKLLNYLDSINL